MLVDLSLGFLFWSTDLYICLCACGWILYQLNHKRSPRILEWVAFPFSSGSSDPGIDPGLLHCKRILYQISSQGSPKREVQFLQGSHIGGKAAHTHLTSTGQSGYWGKSDPADWTVTGQFSQVLLKARHLFHLILGQGNPVWNTLVEAGKCRLVQSCEVVISEVDGLLGDFQFSFGLSFNQSHHPAFCCQTHFSPPPATNSYQLLDPEAFWACHLLSGKYTVW